MAAKLAALTRPAPPRMPPAGLRTWLKTSPWLRHLVPTALVLKMAERRGRARWELSSEDRENAMAAMETVVAGTPRAHELSALARAYLIESVVDQALFWQPWRRLRLDAQSMARLHDALGQGRGVLLSLSHFGQYYRATTSGFWSVERLPYVVVGRSFLQEPTKGYAGRYLARWRKLLRAPLVPSDGSFSVLQALLERGEMVVLYFDRPGPHVTRFLGKTATLADGTARLALQTDALVLPLRARRVGHRGCLDVGEPVDPRDFTSVDQLHERLAALHETWILEHPESMRDPRSFGWGKWATADSWIRPKSAGRPA
jgi:lauroyl/myristoyl acyltransferase